MREPNWLDWQFIRLVTYWDRARWFVRSVSRRAVGLCPACPRRIKSGHKFDCGYGGRR